MQFRVWSAALLFLGSYAPLALILLVQDISSGSWGEPICGWNSNWDCTFQVFEHPWMSLGFVSAAFIALALTVVTMKSVRLKAFADVVEAKSIPNDLINYVFPYVVSFMGLTYSEPQQLAGFLVFWAGLFVVTFKSGQILMNPVLIVMGWRLYEAKVRVGQGQVERIVRVLKRGELLPGKQRMEVVQDVYMMGDP